MQKSTPTRQQLEDAIALIYHEMGCLYAYWVWWTQARPILLANEQFRENSMQYALMQNSAIVITLLAVRKMNEFFKARPEKNDERDDDLRAYDFPGFDNMGVVINPKDFSEIHKRIAHMTYRQVDFGKVTYELYDAVGLVLPKCIKFLDYVRNTFYAGSENKKKDIEIVQKGLIAMRWHWDSERQKVIDGKTT